MTWHSSRATSSESGSTLAEESDALAVTCHMWQSFIYRSMSLMISCHPWAKFVNLRPPDLHVKNFAHITANYVQTLIAIFQIITV